MATIMTTMELPRIDEPLNTVEEEKKTSDHPSLVCENKGFENDSIPVMQKIDYELLASRCLMLLKHHPDRCVFVGIAGAPGSGKSFIADKVKDIINRRNVHVSKEICKTISMDGYHLSRKQLQDKAEGGELFKVDENDHCIAYRQMNYDELMQRRGAPFTFWPEKLIHDLRCLKATGEGSFPGYIREDHDPVQDQIFVRPHNRIILVEGLYLLSFEDPDWQPLEEIWDDTWFIDVSMEETKRRLITRHLKTWCEDKTRYWGGSDEAAAARKAEANDLLNARWIMKNARHNAKLIINNDRIHQKTD